MSDFYGERAGLPSASHAEENSLCPGRHHAQSGMFEKELALCEEAVSDLQDKTKRGTLIHAAWKDGKTHETAPEFPELEGIIECEKRAIRDWKRAMGTEECATECIREERLWYYDKEKPIYSGQPDAVYILNHSGYRHALILDLKTGWSATHGSSNKQLMDLAVIATVAYSLSTVTVAIIPPSYFVDLIHYNAVDLMHAKNDMLSRLARIENEKDIRVPGVKQCTYCLCRASCPAVLKEVQALKDIQLENGADLSNLQEASLYKLYAQSELARVISSNARAEVMRRLSAGENVGDLYIQEVDRYTIHGDVDLIYEGLQDVLAPTDFKRCLTVGWKKLNDNMRRCMARRGKDEKLVVTPNKFALKEMIESRIGKFVDHKITKRISRRKAQYTEIDIEEDDGE